MARFDVDEDELIFHTRLGIHCTVIGNIILGLSFVFVIVATVILGLSRHEDPNKPIRVWLGVFIGLWIVMCILSAIPPAVNIRFGRGLSIISVTLQLAGGVWWIVGLYWIISGGKKLMDCAPLLFWMTTVLIGMGAVLIATVCCLCSCMCCWGTIISCIFFKVSDTQLKLRFDDGTSLR